MKKTVLIILTVATAFALNGCIDEAADYSGAKHYETESIFVLDNNVYVTGWYYPDQEAGGSKVECYWVNGKRVDTVITDDIQSITRQYSTPKSFRFILDYPRYDTQYAVYGNDLYKLGESCYWKNEEEIEITLDDLASTYEISDISLGSIFVSENEVYIQGTFTGTVIGDEESERFYFLWHDGTTEYVSSDYFGSDLYIDNENIYTVKSNDGGAYKNMTLIPGSDINKFWYFSIIVEGDDVYIFGEDWSEDSLWYYFYWKNDEKIDIDTDGEAIITSMFVHNGDVYFSGWYTTNGYYTISIWETVEYSKPCYFKNGKKIDLK